MSEFVNWVWNRLERGQRGTLPNGILYLKGGDLAEELALTGKRWDVYDIARFFEEEFFETKKVLKRDIVKFAEFGDRLQRGESYFVFIAGNTQTRIVQNILFRMIVLFPDFR